MGRKMPKMIPNENFLFVSKIGQEKHLPAMKQ